MNDELVLYYRTDNRGDITSHAVNDKGMPLCGVGEGVDGHVLTESTSYLQCNRCHALLERRRAKAAKP